MRRVEATRDGYRHGSQSAGLTPGAENARLHNFLDAYTETEAA